MFLSLVGNKDIVVLDIEAVFESYSKEKKTDRVDIIVFDISKQKIFLVEAKHFSNSEIWASKINTAKVVSQISRYRTQIANRKNEILDAYKAYIIAINGIFGYSLPIPVDVEDDVILLVFGFDTPQRSKLTKKVFTSTMTGVRRYIIGNQNKINLNTMLTQAKIL